MKFLIIILFVTPFIFSQSEYIDGNSFGLSGGYNYGSNDNSSIDGFDLALTFLGSIDFGYQYSEGKTEVDFYENEVHTLGNLVYLAYNFKKRENKFNLKVLAGYFSGDTKYHGDKLKSSGILIGLGFYPRILKEDVITLRASIELSYGFLSTSTGYSYYGSDNSEFDNSRSLSIGLNLKIGLSPNINLALAPFISKDLINSDNPFFFGIGGRLILSFDASESETKD